MKVRFRPEVAGELAEAIGWYEAGLPAWEAGSAKPSTPP
jgi:DNA-binding transcriptional regulator YiaG